MKTRWAGLLIVLTTLALRLVRVAVAVALIGCAARAFRVLLVLLAAALLRGRRIVLIGSVFTGVLLIVGAIGHDGSL